MNSDGAQSIRSAEVVLPCAELEDTLEFFAERLGFRVAEIFPADDPSVAVITGHGLRIRLQLGGEGSPGVLRLACEDPATVAGGILDLSAPNGTRVQLVEADPALALPALQPSFALSRAAQAEWGVGRAGMRYRDLIPDRQGGRFIASHIQIPAGGPVPDYVHFHKVRFQMIYCYQGWVRVVYEDQGPSFELHAGDCVLQPPRIRHRVLDSSPGLEVIEITSPADHETHADLDLQLPTGETRSDRDFGGQRFLRHESEGASWGAWRLRAFESRDIGIATATAGIAGAQVVRSQGTGCSATSCHDAEFLFTFVLKGAATLEVDGLGPEPLAVGDSFVIPAGLRYSLAECSNEFELLEVSLPGTFKTIVS